MQNQRDISPEQHSSDENWRWTFYHNPKDSRVFVPKRRGGGTTLNFAHSAAYLFLSIPFAFALFLVLAVWLAKR